MAILQGVTELFPVSSLGHAVILPRLLHWGVDQKAPDWLAYLVVMHLGTAIALFAYLWRDWQSFLRSLISAPDSRAKTDRRTFFFVVLATIPAVLVGSVFRKLLGDAFAAPVIAAVFLIVNGFILYFGDRIAEELVGSLDQLNWKGALAVGVAQCFALIPGISRSCRDRRRRRGRSQACGGCALFVPDGRPDHSRRQRLLGTQTDEGGGDARGDGDFVRSGRRHFRLSEFGAP